MRERPVCAVPGCMATLYAGNRSGVCRAHNHGDWCACPKCSGPVKRCTACGGALSRYSRTGYCQQHAWMASKPTRATVSGMIFGCPTTVTADSAEEAERFLEALRA